MKRLLALLLLSLCSLPALAKMQARPVDWTLGKQIFSGVLVYDDAAATKRPGLLMVPDWKGVTADSVRTAQKIAGNRYVVLVADVYGKGVRPKDDAAALAQVKSLYADRHVLRERANKALQVLRAQAAKAPLDPAHVGAIGFCFGGATVLELARNGADIAGVASFHGTLPTSLPAKPGVVKASMLVLNGANDANTTLADVAAFKKEMDAAGVDWQFVDFSGAVHCFALGNAHSPPNCLYNPRAAKRAYAMMDDFFRERFAGH
ncbi:dienelactone hydrolase family protein [Cognatiluteimonas telluris]|uniref:dienelactone hydrolase family protein n=1 Tax=Cognatiluteimonas telluris TaxID=1104775 RepID=UPI00140B8B8B|nr:dienelactone hydrolase family protein [Lysobacter telluris]